MEDNKLKNILEAALMSVGKPMSIEQLMKLFDDEERPSATRVKDALEVLAEECEGRGVELKTIASGYRYQARQDYSEWLSRLWEEKPAKYSRAYLETLALIAYRQPVTRAEIEEVRGVSVSSNIIKTMLEREWIRVVGHRDVPGRPALYATTKQFLDYFNMKSLEELPSLAEIRDLEDLSPELDLPEPGQQDEESNLPPGESEGLDSVEATAGDEENQVDIEEAIALQSDEDTPQLASEDGADRNEMPEGSQQDSAVEAELGDEDEMNGELDGELVSELESESLDHEESLNSETEDDPFEEPVYEENEAVTYDDDIDAYLNEGQESEAVDSHTNEAEKTPSFEPETAADSDESTH
ncbi:SMC-Scp complex subunit ScpB [Aliikangiella marina]|uniref:SMC-Scp complex subunit ScpB n=1 Tax=Aliikangiella marina TaxID=1712262 RepID=A0A545TK03_9GAMM|nr:SMC-Scp complex subunit ScpB [Aliikangiella marina]